MSEASRTAPASIGRAERTRAAKGLRKAVPRSSHGAWRPAPDRPDPVGLLQRQDEGRLAHLLPIKYGRMIASPFAFLRGSAAVMAADLAASPTTGLEVALCGDAHLYNFGLFATPERNLVFDINDFDETYFGPWEWDLKRLAASAVVAGRERGFDEKTCRRLAEVTSRRYRRYARLAARMSALDVWYYHIDASAVIEAFTAHARRSAGRASKSVDKARSRTSARTLRATTRTVNGRRLIKEDPPLLVRLDNLLTPEQRAAAREQGDIERAWASYLGSLPMERRALLGRYRITDAALRVGGVGSVGTRCTIMLLEGDGPEDAIILQQKQAGPSALEPYLKRKAIGSQAERIVVGQRLMQASSDIFLGWSTGLGQPPRDYYWRQLKDMKGSFDVTAFDADGFATYLAVCAACLARAHARSGDAAAIASYAGSGRVLDRAVADFAVAYADQTERDHQALVEAVRTGRVQAEHGI